MTYLNRDNQPYIRTTLLYRPQPDNRVLVAQLSGDVPDSTSRDPQALWIEFFYSPKDTSGPLGFLHTWSISSSEYGEFEEFVGTEMEALSRAQEHAHNVGLFLFRQRVWSEFSPKTTP